MVSFKATAAGVCLIFHNQSGLANLGLPHLLTGCLGMFLKLLRRFKSLSAPFSPAFLSLGRKFLTHVFALCTSVRSGLVDLATASISQGLSASRAPPRPALPVPVSSLRIPRTLRSWTHARFGLRVTNFSQPPAEWPGKRRAAGASWRVAAPRGLRCPRGRAAGGLGTPRLCVRAAGYPLSQARLSSAPTICHLIPDDWNFLCFALRRRGREGGRVNS